MTAVSVKVGLPHHTDVLSSPRVGVAPQLFSSPLGPGPSEVNDKVTRAVAKKDGIGNVTKVLYIEHDDDNLYMLKMRLERVGDFEVLAADDSEKGCKLAATERPDVILMDLEMPVVDRWQPVRTLKNDPQTCDIPIIGMSAYALDSEREQAVATGCDEFDVKPIEFESLVATIRRVLANPR
jgi:CheY-like chemotaxis protein